MTMPNLINCDGCGEQIEAKDALQCIGCKHNFCPECVDDDDMSIRTVVICGYCEAWGKEVKNLPNELRKSADYLRGLSKKIGPIDFSCEWVTCRRAADEIERLRAIVDKLPKTADGVPITFESTLWVMHAGMLEAVSVFEVADDKFDVLTRCGWFPLHKVYSTREAAEAAKEK